MHVEQKIQAKFDLLPKYKQDEILRKLDLHRGSSSLPATIERKLPKLDISFHMQAGFAAWLANENNWLFLPFVWDAIDYYFYQSVKAHAREELANQIVALLKTLDAHANTLKDNLLYANFSRINLSGVTIWSGDLTGADLSWAMSIKNAQLNFSTAVGADFSGIPDLEIAQLINLGSLYKTKFSIEWQRIDEKKERPPQVQVLEREIIKSYAEALYEKYVPESERTVEDEEVSENEDEEIGEDEETKKEQVIIPLLQLIQLSGFSPLNWGVNDKDFHDKFDALYKNHEKVLTVLKQKIKDVTEKKTGTYYQDRLKSPALKAFWEPAPHAIRTTQVGQLYSAATETLVANNLSSVISQLALVKGEIKKEWNVWDSELLKKINQLVNETINETVNPSASPAPISKQKT